MTAVVGIDLGTTNTVVSVVRSGKALVLPDENGSRLLPSVVSFHPTGEILVGHGAKERRLIDARNTVYSTKRLIGRSWHSDEVQRARQRLPFELREGPTHGPLVVARGETYTLPEISAFVLRKTKAIAERALAEPVERAVVTVPASFNDLQRASTKAAAGDAGLEVIRILNEPTAAALAYGFGRTGHERIAVYDFGGGTFDLTLLDLSDNVFEVLATAGDSFLGGDDLDQAIADNVALTVVQEQRFDPRSDIQVMERLRAAAEQAKVALSSQDEVHMELKELGYGPGGVPINVHFSMSRSTLEQLAFAYVERTFTVCQEALRIAGLSASSFDNVILVGGSSRIPVVRRRVEEFFGRKPLDRINPDEVVAIGAAIQAAALSSAERKPPTPAVSFSPAAPATTALGTRVSRKPPPPPLPPRNSQAPVLGAPPPPPPGPSAPPAFAAPEPRQPPAYLPGLPPVNPLESGAKPSGGAAMFPGQPAPLPYPSADVAFTAPLLIDVTPLSLAVETVGGFVDTVIARNASVPCAQTRRFTTSTDEQSTVLLRICQGESAIFVQNTSLGELELSGLRPARRGEVIVEVTFELDADGMLRVHARDVETNRTTHARMRLLGVERDR